MKIALFPLLFAVSPIFAQDLLLPPTYETGKEYLLQNVQHTEIAGGGGNQTIDLSLDIRVHCERAKGRGRQRVLQTTITRLKADMNLGAVAMNYNSEEAGSEKTLLGQTFQNIVNQEIRIFLNEAGEVVEVDGLQDLKANNPLAQQFGPKQLTRMVIPQLNLGIPARGVRIGDTWKNQVDENFGAGTSLKVDYQMKYAGDDPSDGRIALVDYTAGLAMKLTGGGGQGKDPRLSLTVEDGKMNGRITIDKKLRFPKKGTTNLTMTMKAPNPQNPAETLDLPVKQTLEFRVLSVKRAGR